MTDPSERGSRPRQLIFDLAREPSYAAENFLISASNESAFAAITAWPNWIDRVLVLIGPEGSGKSHLAAIWAEAVGARSLDATLDTPQPGAPPGALLVEDCDRRALPERDMFHLLNRVRGGCGWLLLTARAAPGEWKIGVADLLSRLRLAPIVSIGHPDAELMKAVLVKLFSDRQIAIEEDVISYAARHCDRSFAAARSFVEEADKEALQTGSRITRPLAARIVARASATKSS